MSERDDKALTQALGGGSEVSRVYREGARDEPPAGLDDAILAAARREVAARPKPARALHSWYLPVSIAAALVVSVTLTLLVVERGEEPLVPAVPRLVPPSETPASQPSPQPAPETQRAARPKETVPAVTPQTKPAPAQRQVAKKPTAEPKPFADEAAAHPATGTASDLSPSSGAMRGGGAASPATEAAPAQPMLRERAAGQPAMKSMDRAGTPEKDTLPPEKWLEKIAELRRQGRIAEAEASLAEFKKRYPGYAVPGERN